MVWHIIVTSKVGLAGISPFEPVQTRDPVENSDFRETQRLNRFRNEITAWTALGVRSAVSFVHEPVQNQWTGSKHLLNRFTENLFWCAIAATELRYRWSPAEKWLAQRRGGTCRNLAGVSGGCVSILDVTRYTSRIYILAYGEPLGLLRQMNGYIAFLHCYSCLLLGQSQKTGLITNYSWAWTLGHVFGEREDKKLIYAVSTK